MPLSAGTFLKKSSNASRPPADAPIPMMGKPGFGLSLSPAPGDFLGILTFFCPSVLGFAGIFSPFRLGFYRIVRSTGAGLVRWNDCRDFSCPGVHTDPISWGGFQMPVIAMFSILFYGLLIPANKGSNHPWETLPLYVPALSHTSVNVKRGFYNSSHLIFFAGNQGRRFKRILVVFFFCEI